MTNVKLIPYSSEYLTITQGRALICANSLSSESVSYTSIQCRFQWR